MSMFGYFAIMARKAAKVVMPLRYNMYHLAIDIYGKIKYSIGAFGKFGIVR